ncbi:hypothetical protein RRG08_016360 [Elysia crispata]|uniref:Uncharacterized protein n=1 Tax=Elysia crispata TaxID=231223 RepID=A0AAE1DXB8_9GAST|nr:hypothetical protein RRG08_016360 [Elysia crispata]
MALKAIYPVLRLPASKNSSRLDVTMCEQECSAAVKHIRVSPLQAGIKFVYTSKPWRRVSSWGGGPLLALALFTPDTNTLASAASVGGDLSAAVRMRGDPHKTYRLGGLPCQTAPIPYIQLNLVMRGWVGGRGLSDKLKAVVYVCDGNFNYSWSLILYDVPLYCSRATLSHL